LVPIANRPLIGYVLMALKEAGVTQVSVCANGHTAMLRRALGAQAMGLRLDYFQDAMPRGPAGCARDAAALMGANEFIVIEGALLPHIDIREMITAHRQSGAALTVGVDRSVPPSQWNEGQSPRILGVYVFSASVLPHIPRKGYHCIKEQLIPKLHKAGHHVKAFCLGGAAPRVSGPESYLSVNSWALHQIAAGHLAAPGYERHGDVFIHPKASVASTARLAGPVIIGPGTVIHDEAVVIGPTSIGAGCEVGPRAVVCFSAVWDSVLIGADSHVDESILATGACVAGNAQAVRTVHLPDDKRLEEGGVRRTLGHYVPSSLWNRRKQPVAAESPTTPLPLSTVSRRERSCSGACQAAGSGGC
jgi:NDP-sugar pyrophosphorylase family protein